MKEHGVRLLARNERALNQRYNNESNYKLISILRKIVSISRRRQCILDTLIDYNWFTRSPD